jgi:GNAT superfamily N-acetyltransferase
MPTQNDKIIIREFEQRDTGAVTEFLARLQDHVASLDQLKQYFPYQTFNRDAYFAMQLKTVQEKSGKIFVAEADGSPVGVAVGWLKDANGSDQVECQARRIFYINDLFVEPARRSDGVGASLLGKMEDYAHGCHVDHIALSCMAANESARRFYQREGYEEYSVRLVKNLARHIG